MNRFFLVSLLLILFLRFEMVEAQTLISSPQENQKENVGNDSRKNLKKSVENLTKALKTDNYEKLAQLLFIPKTFENNVADSDSEQREKNLASVKQVIEQAKFAGLKFDTKIESAQKIIAVDNRLFSIIPQNTIIIVGKNSLLKDKYGQIIQPGQYRASGYLLAISDTDGKTWRFWNEVSEGELKNEFPEAAKKIKLPAIQKPSFLL